ncbi:MAG TPA: PaaI family thioesterase [Candidatus Binataceae bacterium]|nr:PaaI family thioesterase [Candidatus Binataceae bacterium]
MIDDDHQRALARLMGGPFVSALKLKLDATTEGAATVRLPYGPTILNAGEADVVIHGGAIAALIDTAACAAVWTMPETRNSATVSMSVNYTAPGIRSDLIADAKVRRKGRRLASVAVEVSDNAGALIADALVTYKIA